MQSENGGGPFGKVKYERREGAISSMLSALQKNKKQFLFRGVPFAEESL
jgi:hypothetical protein